MIMHPAGEGARDFSHESRSGQWTSGGPAIDVALARWGIGGEHRPGSVGDLALLHRAWLANVPFENVTKLIRAAKPRRASPRRSPREFWSDHLEWGSGGTCFDVTAAFKSLLRRRGFTVRYIFCRLPEAPRRSHVALLVTVDERSFLVDAGFALPAPVLLPEKAAISRRRTPFYDIEVRHGVGKEFLVFTHDDRGSRFRYAFDTTSVTAGDFRAAWDQTYAPGAPYMNRLALGRFRRRARYIYKSPASLFILSRREQRLLHVPAEDTRRLSRIFGLPGTLLERGITALACRI